MQIVCRQWRYKKRRNYLPLRATHVNSSHKTSGFCIHSIIIKTTLTQIHLAMPRRLHLSFNHKHTQDYADTNAIVPSSLYPFPIVNSPLSAGHFVVPSISMVNLRTTERFMNIEKNGDWRYATCQYTSNPPPSTNEQPPLM